jgi:hypothetical protein
MPIRLLLSLCIFLMVPTLTFAWDGKADNKPIDDLSLMTDWELCGEVQDVCQYASAFGLTRPAMRGDGLSYLGTIQRVLRARHGAQGVPTWWQTMHAASANGDVKSCGIEQCFVELKELDAAPPKKETQRSVPKKK